MTNYDQKNPVKSPSIPVSVALPSTIAGQGVTMRALCEKWGFQVFGRASDSLMWAMLPRGWQLDNMRLDYVWQSMRDDKGRLRMTMEYFSQNGMQRALMTVIPRFEAYSKITGDVVVQDNGTGQVIFSCSTVKNGAENAIQRARDWLKKHYPEYEDAMAYWGYSYPADRNPDKEPLDAEFSSN